MIGIILGIMKSEDLEYLIIYENAIGCHKLDIGQLKDREYLYYDLFSKVKVETTSDMKVLSLENLGHIDNINSLYMGSGSIDNLEGKNNIIFIIPDDIIRIYKKDGYHIKFNYEDKNKDLILKDEKVIEYIERNQDYELIMKFLKENINILVIEKDLEKDINVIKIQSV